MTSRNNVVDINIYRKLAELDQLEQLTEATRAIVNMDERITLEQRCEKLLKLQEMMDDLDRQRTSLREQLHG